MRDNTILKVDGLKVNYDTLNAIVDFSLFLNRGEIISLIGANGAGKTTFIKTVSGILKPLSGSILFEGSSILNLRPDKIVRSGIIMVPEGRKIFPDMTVRENLELGSYSLKDKVLCRNLWDMVLGTFPRIKERLKQIAGTLSGGEQQMLAIGRALMGNPKLLLLDEPSMGLSPKITREIFELVSLINKEKGISIILVEQNAHMAIRHSHRTYVMENGRISIEGMSSKLKDNPRIIKAYLGG